MLRAIIAIAAAAALLQIAGPAAAQESCPVENMDQFKHINTLVVPDPDSPIHGIHHFYMNENGMKTFRSTQTPKEYPDGVEIVGKVFKVHETDEGRLKEGDLAAYTHMEKDAGASDTQETGGWRFVMYTAAGGKKDVDPVQACFQCHQPSPETDYVLSTPLK